ncbi:gamma-glutamylcyclotransferase [Pseudomonas anuradhapurensis]|uniref:gamma-glutamylcyclotransferase n=1 Tax=Pseudomonas anuradhapurensis TaxID=485870 RepID=UPI0016461433|nr:gamma-glutamylcyclotransferase [Pseudomonas anuradhapurensis]QXI45908.1 gamma-glutamylcyclotransferase [Pseudomonas anuradhapurensis]
MLTKDTLSNGLYLQSLAALSNLAWSEERIQESLDATMAKRPGHGEIWLFAYGSLIWNPLLDFVRRELATLKGWHRSFCLKMVAGRGTPDVPGRMLALEPGGITDGVVFQLDGPELERDLQCVWRREMVFGSYTPIWAPIHLEDQTSIDALVFVADPGYALYEADSSVSTIAYQMAVARGTHGTNAEYLRLLRKALYANGLSDNYVEALHLEVERHSVASLSPFAHL